MKFLVARRRFEHSQSSILLDTSFRAFYDTGPKNLQKLKMAIEAAWLVGLTLTKLPSIGRLGPI
jgi:hypothetical protein